MTNKKLFKTLLVLILILTALTQISCKGDGLPSGNKPGGNEEEKNVSNVSEEADWDWRQIGPDNTDINQIQVTADGAVYLLSEGKLFQVKGEEFLEMGPENEVTIFYIMEYGKEKLIIAGAPGGEIFTKKGDGPWNKLISPVIEGQPVNAIASDNKRGILYVGQSSKMGGGLWRSLDEGKSWEKLTDITVRTAVVHPQERDYLYIVDKAAYRSEDRGRNWKKIETPANYGLLIHPQIAQEVYLAYSKGVIMTDPRGQVKNRIDFNLGGAITCLEFNFAKPSEWAVSMWDYPSGSGGLYFSHDKGATWIKADEKLDKIRVLDMRFGQEGDRLYLGTAGHGLWVFNLRKIR